MTTIMISDASFTVSGKLVAGDTILVRLDNVGLQEDARVRLVITAIPPPDARHLVAATGLLSSAVLDTQLLLKSTELRNALKGAHVSESVPVMIEAIDETHSCVLGALRYQIENSAALWIGSAQKYPIPDPIYALSDDLKRHELDRSNPHGVTAAQVGADPSGTAADAVSAHNASGAAHADIRSAVAKVQSAAESASASAQTVAGAINAHVSDKTNPHGVTEAQVAAASTGDADKAFGRLNDGNTWYGLQVVRGDHDVYGAIRVRNSNYPKKTVTMGHDGTDSHFTGGESSSIWIRGSDKTAVHILLTPSRDFNVRKGSTNLLSVSPTDATFNVPVAANNGLNVSLTSGETTAEVMSVSKTEDGNIAKFKCNVSAEGCLIDASAFVTPSLLLIDKENGKFYEVCASGGKLVFNNSPITLEQVQSSITSSQA